MKLIHSFFTFGVVGVSAIFRDAKPCAPFKGNFTIEVDNLYPESAAFDAQTCKIFIRLVSTIVQSFDPQDLRNAHGRINRIESYRLPYGRIG
jgi:hypothetical protein